MTDTAYTLQVLTFILIILAALLLLVGMKMLRQGKAAAQPAAPKAAQAVVQQPRASAPAGGLDAGVVAAITAAIACVLDQESGDGTAQGFVVRRIRRV